MMSIAEMEEYLLKNKHIRQVITPINISGGVMGVNMKNDGGWKDNLSRIAEAHPNSALADRYGKRSAKRNRNKKRSQETLEKTSTREKKEMTKDIPDYMRGFDLTDDWGMTPVSAPPKQEQVVVDTKPIENASLEISKVKADVSSIKSMMNEVMQIVAEKDTITKEVSDEDQKAKMKELEKIILPFLYNLSKTTEPYIHWPNRGPIIKAQIEKVLKITRG